MKGLRDLSAVLLVIAFTWTLGAIWGCNDDRLLACNAVDIAMSGEYMAVVILILICFIGAIIGNARNKS